MYIVELKEKTIKSDSLNDIFKEITKMDYVINKVEDNVVFLENEKKEKQEFKIYKLIESESEAFIKTIKEEREEILKNYESLKSIGLSFPEKELDKLKKMFKFLK